MEIPKSAIIQQVPQVRVSWLVYEYRMMQIKALKNQKFLLIIYFEPKDVSK